MIELVVIAIICAVIIIYLRSVNSELALLATIVSGIIILTYSFEYLSSTFNIIKNLVELTGIDNELYVIIFKITAIGYLVEFGASTIRDFGLSSLADKLVFVGKLIIFSLSLPIIYGLLNMLVEVLQ